MTGNLKHNWLRILSNTAHHSIFEEAWCLRICPQSEVLQQQQKFSLFTDIEHWLVAVSDHALLSAQTLPRFETWVSTTLTLNLVQLLAKRTGFLFFCAAHYYLSWQVFKMPASVRCTIRNFCNSSKALHWEHLCGELCVTAWLATLQLLRICDFYLRFVTKLIIILDFSTFESIE